jgi:NADH-quinone oxidoreductase subunit E
VLREKYQAEVDAILARYPAEWKRSAVMPLLYLAQKEYGHLSADALAEVGALCGLSVTDVAGVVGFYSLYHDHPAGKRRVQVCTDLPCALRGAETFAAELLARLGVQWEGTTLDGEFTLEHVMCVGACDKAPVFQVQDQTGIHFYESRSAQEPMTVEQALEILNGLKAR